MQGDSSVDLAIDPFDIQVELSENGTEVAISGGPGSVKPGAKVVITNTRTGESISVTAINDGSFEVKIPAKESDEIKIVVVDSNGNESKPIEVVARKPQTHGTALISGTVYDVITKQPLSGVVIKARGVNGSASSAANGNFVLPVPGRGLWAIFLKKEGYIETRRDVATRPGGDATTGKVGLRSWDEKVAVISAKDGGTFSDSTGNLEVVFPPGFLDADLTVLASFLESREAFPLPLPNNMSYLGGVQMGPEHVHFNSPVTMRIRNTYELPAGTEVDFYFASHDQADGNESYYDPGKAQVTADGKFFEFRVSHFSCMALGGPPPPPDRIDDDDNENDQTEEEEDPCKSSGQGGGSYVQHCNGNLLLRHDLPPFYAFGQNDAPAIVYSSKTAFAEPYISANVKTNSYYKYNNDVEAALKIDVDIEGQATQIFFQHSDKAIPFHFKWDGRNGRGTKLPTGSYPYRLSAENLANVEIAGAAPVGVPMTFAGRVILENRSDSSFGAGWGLAELQRIHRNPDGSLLLTRGAGGAIILHSPERILNPPVVLADGFSDSRSITVGANGNRYVSSRGYGSIYRIAADGTKTLVASGLGALKGLTIDRNDVLYAGSERGGIIYRINPGETAKEFIRLSRSDHLDDLAIDSMGNLFVLDGGFGVIRKITPAGEESIFYEGVFGSGTSKSLLTNSMSLAIDKQDNLYVSNNYNGWGYVTCGRSFISRFDKLGNHSYYFVGLNVPRGIALDADGNLYVVDFDCTGDSYEIRVITPAKENLTIAKGIEGDVNAFGLAYDLAMRNGTLNLVRPKGDVLSVKPLLTGDSFSHRSFAANAVDFSQIVQDKQGNLIRTERNGTVYKYSREGLLLETRQPQGLFWRYNYDTQERLITRTNAAGHRWVFRYGSNGLSEVEDAAGRIVKFTIDSAGNLVQVLAPLGAVMRYEYDSAHRIVTKIDSRNNSSEYLYGSVGNVIETKQANGEIRKFSSAKARIAITKKQADESTLDKLITLVDDGREDIYTNGLGYESRMLLNKYGALLRETDALGNETHYKRERNNKVTEITYASGAVERFEYNSVGQITASLRDGNATSQGRFDQYTPLFTRYKYDDHNLATEINSGYKPTVKFTYDDNQNISDAFIGDKNELHHQFQSNQFGQVTRHEISGLVTSYEYNADGRLIGLTNPNGDTTEFEYDTAGNRIKLRDALDRETLYRYDLLGRLVEMIDPAGDSITFTNQSACATCGTEINLVTGIKDAMGRVTQFQYDELGQLTAEIDPAGKETLYQYDANRNLIRRQDPSGNATEYVYDPLDRLIKKILPDDEVIYVYDVSDNLLNIADRDSRIEYRYDKNHRITDILTGGDRMVQLEASQEFDGYKRELFSVTKVGSINQNWQYTTSHDLLWRTHAISQYNPSGTISAAYSFDNLDRRQSASIKIDSDDAFLETIEYKYDAASHLVRKSIKEAIKEFKNRGIGVVEKHITRPFS